MAGDMTVKREGFGILGQGWETQCGHGARVLLFPRGLALSCSSGRSRRSLDPQYVFIASLPFLASPGLGGANCTPLLPPAWNS
jgi:hypothetical protein